MDARSEGSSSLERVAYSVPEFCFRNHISRSAYRQLRLEGRAPVEMRLGINTIRITAAAERAWQEKMQEPRPDLDVRAVERAAKAGKAAAKSASHISKSKRTRKRRTT